MRIRVRSNIDEVFRQLDADLEAMQTIGAPRALNVLQGQATVVGYRKIAEVYGVGPRTIEKYASVQLASANDPTATVTVKGKGFPLGLFNPIPTPRGVSVRIKGVRHLYPGTFLATVTSGEGAHVGVFGRGAYGGKGITKRTGNIGRFVFGRGRRVKRPNKWGISELPINELYTFSPPDTFANDEVVDPMLDRIEEQAPKVFAREFAAVRRGF